MLLSLTKFGVFEGFGKEGPRLIRSGLALFVSRLLSVVTGMLFVIIITRNTTKEQFGVWVNVNADIVAYFTWLAAALPFWVMRFVARGHEGSAKTGVLANLFIGLLSTAVYMSLVPFILLALNVSGEYLLLYMLASVQIIQVYLLMVFQSHFAGC